MRCADRTVLSWVARAGLGLRAAAMLVLAALVALASVVTGPQSAAAVGAAGPRQRFGLEGLSRVAGTPGTDWSRIDGEPVRPETWRRIVLSLAKTDGSELEAVLLRPLWWLDELGVRAGGTVDLELTEIGASGAARVLEVGPCEVDGLDPSTGGRVMTPAGPRVVTGRFRHTSAEVLDLVVAHGERAAEGDGTSAAVRTRAGAPTETIGTTAGHPFWSEDRGAWVRAGLLRPGERLQAADGAPARVVSLAPRASPETVWNLEVQGEHVFRVGGGGLLVHNNNAGCPGGTGNTSRGARREAMREQGIPTSQQPDSQRRTPQGMSYDYTVDGNKRASVQQTSIPDGNHGPHWEAGRVKTGGQTDPLGRPRLQSDKSRVEYDE